MKANLKIENESITVLPSVNIKEFKSTHPSWDQYRVMCSAIANFLFQNGCGDRAVTEQYLNDLFIRSEA